MVQKGNLRRSALTSGPSPGPPITIENMASVIEKMIVIDGRLQDIITISPNQCSFVSGRSTTDAIYAMRLLIKQHREKNKTVQLAFLDLEKAFDLIPHDLIWHSLRSHGVPEAYVDWVTMLYHHTTSIVRCAAGKSSPFDICIGVHQGSALLPLLFLTCMDMMTTGLIQ